MKVTEHHSFLKKNALSWKKRQISIGAGVGREFALHATDVASIPRIPYGSSILPCVTLDFRHRCQMGTPLGLGK